MSLHCGLICIFSSCTQNKRLQWHWFLFYFRISTNQLSTNILIKHFSLLGNFGAYSLYKHIVFFYFKGHIFSMIHGCLTPTLYRTEDEALHQAKQLSAALARERGRGRRALLFRVPSVFMPLWHHCFLKCLSPIFRFGVHRAVLMTHEFCSLQYQ